MRAVVLPTYMRCKLFGDFPSDVWFQDTEGLQRQPVMYQSPNVSHQRFRDLVVDLQAWARPLLDRGSLDAAAWQRLEETITWARNVALNSDLGFNGPLDGPETEVFACIVPSYLKDQSMLPLVLDLSRKLLAGNIGDNHPLKPLRSMKTLRRCQFRLDIALNLLRCGQET